MLTKIKKDLKQVTWFGWVTFGIAAVALWFAFAHKPHRPPHKPNAAPAAISVEK